MSFTCLTVVSRLKSCCRMVSLRSGQASSAASAPESSVSILSLLRFGREKQTWWIFVIVSN